MADPSLVLRHPLPPVAGLMGDSRLLALSSSPEALWLAEWLRLRRCPRRLPGSGSADASGGVAAARGQQQFSLQAGGVAIDALQQLRWQAHRLRRANIPKLVDDVLEVVILRQAGQGSHAGREDSDNLSSLQASV